ncbi:MAG TPA: hypothetical protein VHV08_02330 [Pirellulales bacterium]|jgi:hypothetical protein|nr:hypothetical protein [Pirellulales bacterium]
MERSIESRRNFTAQSLGSLLTFSLLETLCSCDLLADEIRPNVNHWLAGVNQLGLDLKGEKLEQTAWQQKIEQLMAQVSMPDLLSLIDFDRLAANVSFAERGERSLRFSFPKVDGVPNELSFGKQIFALKKGRSVVPHGHNNMATAFLILKGDLRGRHYQRIKDEPGAGDEGGHMIIEPTVDRNFTIGECSTVSDFKNNVHWFQAVTEPAFIFNLHILDINPASKLAPARVYVDPHGEKLAGGLTRARVIGYKEANQLYG